MLNAILQYVNFIVYCEVKLLRIKCLNASRKLRGRFGAHMVAFRLVEELGSTPTRVAMREIPIIVQGAFNGPSNRGERSCVARRLIDYNLMLGGVHCRR